MTHIWMSANLLYHLIIEMTRVTKKIPDIEGMLQTRKDIVNKGDL